MNIEVELSHKDSLGMIDRKLFKKITNKKQKKEIAYKISVFTDSAIACEEWPRLIEEHTHEFDVYTHTVETKTYAKIVHYFFWGMKRDMHIWKLI